MSSTNMEFGDRADQHAPGPNHKGVFWWVEDESVLEFCDGTQWLPAAAAATPTYGFRAASAISGNPYVNTFVANAGNTAALQGGQHTLVLPAQTEDMAVTIYASFPAPYVQRGAYVDQLRLKEQLIIQDSNGFTTGSGLPVYDAETRELAAFPAEGSLNPDLNTFMRGHGFQGQYHTFVLPSGQTTTLQFDVNWQLSDDGTESTYGIVDGLDNPVRRVSAVGVPIP